MIMMLKVVGLVLLIGLAIVGFLELTLNSKLFLTNKYYRSKAKKRVKQYIKENSSEIERIHFIRDKLNSLPMKIEKREEVLSRLSEFGNITFLDYDRKVIDPCSGSYFSTIRFIVNGSSVEYDFSFYSSACYFYCDDKIVIIDIARRYLFERRTMILVIEDNILLPVYYAWQKCTLQDLEEKLFERPNSKIVEKFFGLEAYREGDWISYIQNDVRKNLQETTFPSFGPIET